MSKEYLEAKDLQANFIKCFNELLTKTDKNIIVVNISREMAQNMVNLYEKYLTAKPSEALEEISKENCIYKDFADLFFDIFDLEYSKEKYTLNLKVKEPYDLENIDLNICLINEDANKILKVAELLEQENYEVVEE